MRPNDPSLSLHNPDNFSLKITEKLGLTLSLLATAVLLISLFQDFKDWNTYMMFFTIFGLLIGVTLYSYGLYMGHPAGIKNNNVWSTSLSNRGVLGWITAIGLTLFYIALYWYPTYLGYQAGIDGKNIGLIHLFDPLSQFFKGRDASQWFVYGTIYTLVIISLGIKFIYKYRNNFYQKRRTISVMMAQLGFAYLIPEILAGLNFNDATDAEGKYIGYYDTDLKNTWPLDYDFFNDWHLNAMQVDTYQPIGMTYLVWGILFFTILTPIITYYVGKRWYCSWICGCGGLAETAGDSFRQLSSKKLQSWQLERWLIHIIMVWVFLMTAITLYGYFANTGEIFGFSIYHYIQKPYGFLIGAAFSGVIGVGFYPLLGNRVWCRFGCPMAGYMGLFQRFKSRFRITTNGGQCISCGNCSTYCEQGIDVRSYAQKGQNIVRSSCVGCGICSAVCPRGVLKLENAPNDNKSRTTTPKVIVGNNMDLLKEIK